MHSSLRLFTVVAKAALLFTAMYFVLIVILLKLFLPRNLSSVGKAITLAVVLLIPIGLAAWWLFRKLQAQCSRGEALGASIAFACSLPVPLGISLVLGPIVGGYTGVFLGTQSRLVAFAGVVVGIVLMVALVTFIPSLFVVWIVRRLRRAE